MRFSNGFEGVTISQKSGGMVFLDELSVDISVDISVDNLIDISGVNYTRDLNGALGDLWATV